MTLEVTLLRAQRDALLEELTSAWALLDLADRLVSDAYVDMDPRMAAYLATLAAHLEKYARPA